MPTQRVYQSPFPSFEVPVDLSVSQFLLRSNPDDVSSNTPIFSDFDTPDRYVSFGDLRRDASQGAAGLREIAGVEEGDVVCILGHNSVSWALLAHSVMWAGACFW